MKASLPRIAAVLLAIASAHGYGQSQTYSLENPQPGSFHSGLSMYSGWACSNDVQLVIDGVTFRAAAGTPRTGFPSNLCGGNSNVNFGMLRNFNNFGPGPHTVQLVINGANAGAPVQFNVTVPRPAEPFATALSKSVTVSDFPALGQSTTMVWQESTQSFTITNVSPPPNSSGNQITLAKLSACPGTSAGVSTADQFWSCFTGTVSGVASSDSLPCTLTIGDGSITMISGSTAVAYAPTKPSYAKVAGTDTGTFTVSGFFLEPAAGKGIVSFYAPDLPASKQLVFSVSNATEGQAPPLTCRFTLQ